MVIHDADVLVPFEDVKVIRATAPALFCRIGEKSVWLPRGHISGKLWCTGDRGKLFIRRWVARDRNLIDVQRAAIRSPVASLSRLAASLHLVRADRNTSDAE
jgi:hypothetical protein